MQMVNLKNGTEAPRPLVKATMLVFGGMMNDLGGILALYELNKKANDPDYVIEGSYAETLKKHALMEADGKISQDVLNIIQSAASGEGLSFSIQSPV